MPLHNAMLTILMKLVSFIGCHQANRCHRDLAMTRKQFKDCITVALCTNADGSDRIKPFVIGKSAQPQGFKDIAVSTYVTKTTQKHG